MNDSRRSTDLVLAFAVSCVLAAALSLMRGVELWNDSDGQYLLSGMLLADGRELYGEVGAAQPPLMYLLVAVATLIHDSWVTSRVLFSGLQVVTAVLVAAVIGLRLALPRWAMLGGAVACVLSPWALHEHGHVLPEIAGTPFLLGMVLTLTGPSPRPRLAGVLGALAVATKLPFILPVVAMLVVARHRGRAALAFCAALAVETLVFSLWFGPGDLVRGVVTAQGQIGAKTPGEAAGYVAQVVWSLLPLSVLALIGYRVRAAASGKPRTPDRVLVAAVLGAAATLPSVLKLGTLPVVAIPVEALLVPFAIVGVNALFGAGAARPETLTPHGGRLVRPAAVLALSLAVLAAGSLVLSPSAPRGFTWPGGNTNWARVASKNDVGALRDAARACPPGAAWPGSVWIAVLAERRVPGDQADPFIVQAPTYAALQALRRTDAICRARRVP